MNNQDTTSFIEPPFFIRVCVIALFMSVLFVHLSYAQPETGTSSPSPDKRAAKEVFSDISRKVREQYISKNKSIDYNRLFNELFLHSPRKATFDYSDQEKRVIIDVIVQMFKYPQDPEKSLREFLVIKRRLTELTGEDVKKIDEAGLVERIDHNRGIYKWTAFLSVIYVSLEINTLSEITARYGVGGSGESGRRYKSIHLANKRARAFISKKGYKNVENSEYPLTEFLDSDVIASLIREFVKTLPEPKTEPQETATEKKVVRESSHPPVNTENIRTRIRALIASLGTVQTTPQHSCLKALGYEVSPHKLHRYIDERVYREQGKKEKKSARKPKRYMINIIAEDLSSCLASSYKKLRAFETRYLVINTLEMVIGPIDKETLQILLDNEGENKELLDPVKLREMAKRDLEHIKGVKDELALIIKGVETNLAPLENSSIGSGNEKQDVNILLALLKSSQQEIAVVIGEIDSVLRKETPPPMQAKEQLENDREFLVNMEEIIRSGINRAKSLIKSFEYSLLPRKHKSRQGGISFAGELRLRGNYTPNLDEEFKKIGIEHSILNIESLLGGSYGVTPGFTIALMGGVEYNLGINTIAPLIELAAYWQLGAGTTFLMNPYVRTTRLTITRGGTKAPIEEVEKTVDTFANVDQLRMGNRFRIILSKALSWEFSGYYENSTFSGTLKATSGEIAGVNGNINVLGVDTSLVFTF